MGNDIIEFLDNVELLAVRVHDPVKATSILGMQRIVPFRVFR